MNEKKSNSIIKVEDVEIGSDQSSVQQDQLTEPSQEHQVPKKIDLRSRLINDFITFEKEVSVYNGGNSKNYPIFYTANQPCFLIEARLRFEVAGGSGATVDIEKLPSGTVKGSGGSMLASKFSISGSPNVINVVGPTIVLAGYQLVPGDSMALKATGTLTNASNVIVGVLLGMNTKNMPVGQSASAVLVGYN